MENEIIRRLGEIKDLPTLPTIVRKLEEALNSTQISAAGIAAIIAEDLAITAKILRVVNSAYYGRGGGREITSVPYAVARLGFREIRNITLALSVFNLFDKKDSGINLKSFWRHSISVAMTTRIVNDFSQDDENVTEEDLDSYYAAGLLHEVGLLVLNMYYPEKVREILGIYRETREDLQLIEERILGADHASIGGFIARNWELPESIIIPIENPYDPASAPPKFVRNARVLQLADYLCNLHWPDDSVEGLPENQQKYHETLKSLGIPLKHIAEILDLVEEEAAKSEVLVALD